MAQHRHVVDHVEVGATGGRHQEVPPAPLDLRRLAIVKLLHGSETRVASRQQIAGVRHLHRRAARAAAADRGSAPASRAPVSNRVNSGATGAPTGRTPSSTHCVRRCVRQRLPGAHAAGRRRMHPGQRQLVARRRAVSSRRPRSPRRPTVRRYGVDDAAHRLMPVGTTSGLSWLSLRVRLSRASPNWVTTSRGAALHCRPGQFVLDTVARSEPSSVEREVVDVGRGRQVERHHRAGVHGDERDRDHDRAGRAARPRSALITSVITSIGIEVACSNIRHSPSDCSVM